MKQKKIPLRMCVGCKQMINKKEMLRIIKNNENQVCLDLTGKMNGRGAYICSNKECFEKVKKTKGFQRTFQMPVEDEIYNAVSRSLEGLNDK
jgi:predicted RNA-binding protein YlxR (DUF448 family)